MNDTDFAHHVNPRLTRQIATRAKAEAIATAHGFAIVREINGRTGRARYHVTVGGVPITTAVGSLRTFAGPLAAAKFGAKVSA